MSLGHTLVTVNEDAEEHVAHVNKNVGAKQPFPEIPGVTHLGEEGNEEHGSSVAVDSLVETVERTDESGSSSGHSRRRCAGVGMDGSFGEALTIGGFDC
jgi:hypothetical protein